MKRNDSTWLITNFKIPAFSNSTKAMWVKLGIARWNGSDASGKAFPSRCNETENRMRRARNEVHNHKKNWRTQREDYDKMIVALDCLFNSFAQIYQLLHYLVSLTLVGKNLYLNIKLSCFELDFKFIKR